MQKLKLNDNFLITLPIEAMSEMLNLTMLDVSNNRVRRFYDQLMPWIENGTLVFYQGKQTSERNPDNDSLSPTRSISADFGQT